MKYLLTTTFACLSLLGATAPAFADGAGPDDCTAKKKGDACYDYDLSKSGVCVIDDMGQVYCQTDGGGGSGGAGATGSSSGGCSFDRLRASGGAEAAGLGVLFLACVAMQRRRR